MFTFRNLRNDGIKKQKRLKKSSLSISVLDEVLNSTIKLLKRNNLTSKNLSHKKTNQSKKLIGKIKRSNKNKYSK